MELISVTESAGITAPEADGHRRATLADAGADLRTPVFVSCYAGPMSVTAGDILHVSLQLQYANDNSLPKGCWTVNGVQSEHWSNWAMGASGVMLSTNGAVDLAGASWMLYQHEENFDNWRHYMAVDRSGYFTVPTTMSRTYIMARTYFVCSKNYANVGQQLRVVGNGYGKLQVAKFR